MKNFAVQLRDKFQNLRRAGILSSPVKLRLEPLWSVRDQKIFAGL